MPAAFLSVLTPLLSEIISKQVSEPTQAGKIVRAITEGLHTHQHDMEQLFAEMNSAQMQVNQAEAASRSLLIAGWRPAIGWVCVAGLSWMVIIAPVLHYLLQLGGWSAELPAIEHELLFELSLGMLGMAGLRSFEKLKGVTR